MRVIPLVLTPVIRRMIRGVITVISLVVTTPPGAAMMSGVIIAALISQGDAAWQREDHCDYRSLHVWGFDVFVHNSLLQ